MGQATRGDVVWFAPDGEPMTDDRWRAEEPRSVAYVLDGSAITELSPTGERVVDDSLYIAVNGEPGRVRFVLPSGPWTEHWLKFVDTAEGSIEPMTGFRAGDEVEVEGRSIVVLVASG